MQKDQRTPASGLASFWLQADDESSDEHPLERELIFRLDAIQRYRGMIDEAEAIGRDDMAAAILAQHDREAKLIRDLQAALQRRSAWRQA